jgi:hypothetical protein
VIYDSDSDSDDDDDQRQEEGGEQEATQEVPPEQTTPTRTPTFGELSQLFHSTKSTATRTASADGYAARARPPPPSSSDVRRRLDRQTLTTPASRSPHKPTPRGHVPAAAVMQTPALSSSLVVEPLAAVASTPSSEERVPSSAGGSVGGQGRGNALRAALSGAASAPADGGRTAAKVRDFWC